MISVSIVASVDVSSVAKSIQQPGLSISVSLGLGLSLSLLPVDSLYGSSSLFSRSCSSYGSQPENSASEGTRNKSSGIVGTSSVVGVHHGGMNYGSMVNCVRQEVATKTVCKGRVCLSLRRSHQGKNQQELHDD